jgi:hypothetical protein
MRPLVVVVSQESIQVNLELLEAIYSDSQIPSFENDVHKGPDYPIETYAP